MKAHMISDSIFKAVLKDKRFTKDTSPHKYARVWSSSFFMSINKVMRHLDFNTQVSKYPYAIRFISAFMQYFQSHGITPSKLKVTRLYRGISDDFVMGDKVVDNGFMSTTKVKSVAVHFAHTNGSVIRFKVKKLPSDVLMVEIDERIADHLHESEVLFLPGEITKVENNYYTYKPNMALVTKYRNHHVQFGGAPIEHTRPHIDLRNKIVVWYRAIQGRPVEIIAQTFMPKTHKAAVDLMTNHIIPRGDDFDRMTHLIPEVQDLLKEINRTSGADDEAFNKYRSFTVFLAVYDQKTKSFDTLHFGIPDEMANEMGALERQEDVKKIIIQTYG